MLAAVSFDGREACAFEYDGLCRRTAKVAGGRRTEYYWDDDRLAAEVGPTGAVRLYVYADEATRVPFAFVDYDALDAAPEDGRAYHVFHDQVGVPVRVEDAAGAVAWRADHVDPYGEVTVAAGCRVEYNLRFPGHYFDAETGLHYNRFRYYSPALARYLQPDPLGIAGGTNLYAYPADPLVRVDLLGLHTKKAPPKGGAPGNAKKGPGAEAPPAKRAADSGVNKGEVDSYREQTRLSKTGDGLDLDHIPAFASVRDKINDQRRAAGRRPLTKDEQRMLKQNMTTAAVDHDIHKKGRTYADRGGEARRAADGKNLRQAAADDLAEHKKHLVEDAASKKAKEQAAKEADEMAEQVHKRNEALGLYDDPIPSSLWTDPI
jgi:RHS repeat-associated protein